MRERAPAEVRAGAAPRGAYRGLWALAARWLLVPREPPQVPPGGTGTAESFRPDPAHFTYLKAQYFLAASLFLLLTIAAALLAVAVDDELWIALFLLAMMGIGAGAAFLGYLLLRLRFDTTWYVMTDRALRVRRGILTIREGTVTYENIQNVRVRRGPLQRWLGIGDVQVETAAAGRTSSQHGGAAASKVVIEGVGDPTMIRDRIVDRVRESRSDGLGDEEEEQREPVGRGAGPDFWSVKHLAALREIRREAERLSALAGSGARR